MTTLRGWGKDSAPWDFLELEKWILNIRDWAELFNLESMMQYTAVQPESRTWVLHVNNWALIKRLRSGFRKDFSAFAVYCSEICPINWQSSKTHMGWCSGKLAVKHLPKAVEILNVLQALAFCAENGATYQWEGGTWTAKWFVWTEETAIFIARVMVFY